MAEPHRKPFWKRKRWIAIAVVWLAIVYPASLGPLDYLAAKQQLPAIVAIVYRPLLAVLDTLPGCHVSQATGLTRWRLWCLKKGDQEHLGQAYDEWTAWPNGETYDYFLGYGPRGLAISPRGIWGIRVHAPQPR